MIRRTSIVVITALVFVFFAFYGFAQAPFGPPVFEQQLLAGDPGEEAWFGENVAIDGDTAVIGARHEDLGTDPDEQNVGAVYVYIRTAGVWTLEQKITPDPGYWEYDLSFGCSVDISGDTLIIGSYHWNSYIGFAEIWARSAGAWSFQQRLTANPLTPNSWYGFSSAVDGDTAIVGAFNATGAGSVHVYTRNATVWTLEQEYSAPIPDSNDRFGVVVDIKGNTAVVGDNDPPGIAHVFTRTAGLWTLEQSLIPAGTDHEHFGLGLDLDSDQVIIGDTTADVDMVDDAGAVHIFTRSAGLWSEQQRLTSNDPEQDAAFGKSCAIEGDIVVVGERTRDLDGLVDSGAAFLSHRADGSWVITSPLAAGAPDPGARFGNGVALDGGIVVVGGHLTDHSGLTDAGCADVFVADNIFIFDDGFEEGDTDGWDSTTP